MERSGIENMVDLMVVPISVLGAVGVV